MNEPDPPAARVWETRAFYFAIGVVFCALAVLIALVLYDRLVDDDPPQSSDLPAPPMLFLPSYPAEEATVLKRADDAVMAAERATDSADRVMGFLEAASLLVALALGAAAIYGFRNSQETRRELREEVDELKTLRKEIEQHRDALRTLPGQLTRIESTEQRVDESLNNLQPIFIDLLQASQELLLKNFREAYKAIRDVLKRDGDNPMALYIAGWLELQQIEEATLNEAADHLHRALTIAPDWPAAIAAYGVVTRRRGLESAGKTREQYFDEAEGRLRQALGINPGLLDLNRESLRGPLAGILRDSDRIDQAILEYEKACSVTPGSSYPHGNLAALYLRKACQDPGSDSQAKAVATFKKTLHLARAELAIEPNEYYLMMDVSMSTMMLGFEDAENFAAGYGDLVVTLDMENITTKELGVSLRGWTFLHDNCPQGDTWDGVRRWLLWSLQKVRWASVRAHIDREAPTPPADDHLAAALAALRDSVAMPQLDGAMLGEWQADWNAVGSLCPQGDDWTATRQHIQQAQDIIATALAARPTD